MSRSAGGALPRVSEREVDHRHQQRQPAQRHDARQARPDERSRPHRLAGGGLEHDEAADHEEEVDATREHHHREVGMRGGLALRLDQQVMEHHHEQRQRVHGQRHRPAGQRARPALPAADAGVQPCGGQQQRHRQQLGAEVPVHAGRVDRRHQQHATHAELAEPAQRSSTEPTREAPDGRCRAGDRPAHRRPQRQRAQHVDEPRVAARPDRRPHRHHAPHRQLAKPQGAAAAGGPPRGPTGAEGDDIAV